MVHFNTTFTHTHPVGQESAHAADAGSRSSTSSRMQFGAAASAARATAHAVKTTASRVADAFHSIDPTRIATLFARLGNDSHELKAKLAQMGKKAAVAAQGIEQRLRQRLGEALGRHLPAGASLKDAFARLGELGQHVAGRAGQAWSELRKQLSPEKIATMGGEQWAKLVNSFKAPEHGVVHSNMQSLMQHVGIHEFSRLKEHDWQTVLGHLAKGSKFESALQQAGKQTYYAANWETFSNKLSQAGVNVEDYVARHPEKLLAAFVPRTGAGRSGRSDGGASTEEAYSRYGSNRTQTPDESSQRPGFNHPDPGASTARPQSQSRAQSTEQPHAGAGASDGGPKFSRPAPDARHSTSGQYQGNAGRAGFNRSNSGASESTSGRYERAQAGRTERPTTSNAPRIKPLSLTNTPKAQMIDELIKRGFPKEDLQALRDTLAVYLGNDRSGKRDQRQQVEGDEFRAKFGKYFAEDIESSEDRKGFGVLYLTLRKHVAAEMNKNRGAA
ncbi:hypothetical protein FSO04_37345 [Paraburkholderia madseniana]|uniref:Uncharacterized protein n=1 Tax=Paraburkholderia madseniana TaxID=2599607 RepID=A0A6N6W2R4_9BURK|nr:hypothetical protein [Paraburkholderia madseniana]KAE8754892.1 hypothetical protein FSO04_37345 [Paraburkholderia madseniana]